MSLIPSQHKDPISALVDETDSPRFKWILPDVDDKTRRLRFHLLIFMSVIIIALLIFGTLNPNPTGTRITYLMAVVLSIGLISMRYLSSVWVIFRLSTGLFCLFGGYLVWSGNAEGASILWLYAFPLTLFYFLGKYEGLIWMLALLIVSVILLFAGTDRGIRPW